jgi:hypothetical protein
MALGDQCEADDEQATVWLDIPQGKRWQQRQDEEGGRAHPGAPVRAVT